MPADLSVGTRYETPFFETAFLWGMSSHRLFFKSSLFKREGVLITTLLLPSPSPLPPKRAASFLYNFSIDGSALIALYQNLIAPLIEGARSSAHLSGSAPLRKSGVIVFNVTASVSIGICYPLYKILIKIGFVFSTIFFTKIIPLPYYLIISKAFFESC